MKFHGFVSFILIPFDKKIKNETKKFQFISYVIFFCAIFKYFPYECSINNNYFILIKYYFYIILLKILKLLILS